MKTFPASGECAVNTRTPDEMWQAEATCLFVQCWGWYCLISVLHDYGWRIHAWKLQPAMTASAFAEVIEKMGQGADDRKSILTPLCAKDGEHGHTHGTG